MTFCQRCDGAANNLERQLRQFQFLSQLVQNALPEVARIHWPTEAASENERVRRDILAFLPEFLSPFHHLFGQWFSDRDLRGAPLGFSVRTNLPLVKGLLNVQEQRHLKETPPAQAEQLAWPKRIRHIEHHQDPIAWTPF